MTEFNHGLDDSLVKHVFIVGFILFGVLFAYGILLRRSIEAGMARMAPYARTAMTALVLAAAVSAVMGSLDLLNTGSSAAADNPITISINDLQRSIDTRSLPVQQVENLI